MVSKKLLITQNWEDRKQAEKLGMPAPERKIIHSKVLFWKKDVMRVDIALDGNIVVITRDDTYLELEYEEKIWKELEMYFKEHEE